MKEHFLRAEVTTISQACNCGNQNWNVAKGSLHRLKVFFLNKAKIVYYFLYYVKNCTSVKP